MTSSRAKIVLGATFTVFVALIAVLVVSSLARPAVHAFAPRSLARPPSAAAAVETVTVDARDARAWRYLELDGGTREATANDGWDIAVRRYDIIAADAAADVGQVAFANVSGAPSIGWTPTVRKSDTTNAALQRWYQYSFLSHVLESAGRVYVVRTSGGAYIKMQVLSYYCPGPIAGCMTMRIARLGGGAAMSQ